MPSAADSDLLAQAADLIHHADALVITSGAGMGVDSGLPDFRGNQGFWQTYPALGRARLEFKSVATPYTFRINPALAWGFYGHRLQMYRATEPHAGFALLKQWGERMPLGYGLFTSNVDGQFQKAGFDPQRIYECHGSIHHLQCMEPCSPDIWPADAFVPEVDTETCRLLNEPPTCPHCGGMARPNILMFSDWEWNERRSMMQEARLHGWLEAARRPLVIEVGSGTTIPSVRHFGQRVVLQHGGRMIRINPREPQVASADDVGLAMGAAEGLAAIAALLGA
jgi:NAD-dependent SIR2 family protein deacetylase